MTNIFDLVQSTPEHTFYELDGEPILFVCKNETGTRYLFSCCQFGKKWVVCQVSVSALIDLMNDKVTIREVFEKSASSFSVALNGEQYKATNDFPYDALPQTGALLELEYEKTGSYYKKLKEQTDE